MFEFTTTRILNDNKDLNTGEPIIIVGDNSNGFKTGEVLIKRSGIFKKADILSITKAVAEDAAVPQATLAVPAGISADKIYRLALYIGLTDSQNSYYANAFVYKGKPFYVEAVADNQTNLVNAIIKNATKFQTMVYENDLVKLSASSTNLVIKGVDGHQKFKLVELQEWVPDPDFKGAGLWKKIAEATPTAGNPGFGTYEYLLHNLRLPTGANTRFAHIIQDEVPIVGAKYNQYIIRIQKRRGIMGTSSVGQSTTSITTHVFWVKQDLVTAFELGTTALGGVTEVDKDVNDNDPALSLDILEKRVEALEAAAKQ